MKISYADYIKKTNVSILVAEAIFNELAANSKLVKIAEIADTTSGGTPLRNNSDYYGGSIPWLKSGELNDNYISSAEEFITELGLKNSSAKLHPKGTLLVAMYGATVGKTGITQIEACTNQAICAVFPKKNISREYLFWFFKSHRYKFIEQSKGGAQPNISQTVINNTNIPLQSEDAQKEIVLFLDNIDTTGRITETEIPERFKGAIMSVLNVKNSFTDITTELTHQLTLVKQLRQSFLREAMQGKLTADFRSAQPELTEGENSAQALLEKIKVEKKQLIKDGKLKKEKELSPVSEDEIPFEIPESWVWCRLGEICSKIGSGSTPKGSNYTEIGYPFFRSQNIQDYGLIYDDIKYISEEVQIQMKGTVVVSGDILLNITGGSLGRCALVPDDFKKGNVSQHVCIIRPESVDNKFIHKLILSPYIQQCIFSSTTGAGREGLPKYNLEQFIIPLPPLSEQQAIVSKLDDLMRTCDELEASIRSSQQQNEMLLREVLREALEATPNP